jgi:Haem-degrading
MARWAPARENSDRWIFITLAIDTMMAPRRRHLQRNHVVDARRCDHTVFWAGVENCTERRHDEFPTFPSRPPQAERCSFRAASRRVAERRTATPPVGPRASLAAIPHELDFACGHRSDKKANYARCGGGFPIVIKGGTIGAVGLSGEYHKPRHQIRVISTGGNRRRSEAEGLGKRRIRLIGRRVSRGASLKKGAESYGPTCSAERHAILAIM